MPQREDHGEIDAFDSDEPGCQKVHLDEVGHAEENEAEVVGEFEAGFLFVAEKTLQHVS